MNDEVAERLLKSECETEKHEQQNKEKVLHVEEGGCEGVGQLFGARHDVADVEGEAGPRENGGEGVEVSACHKLKGITVSACHDLKGVWARSSERGVGGGGGGSGTEQACGRMPAPADYK
jgi:hypothetical protein